MPISIPAGVDVKIEAGNLVTVKGPKGTLTQQLHPNMTITQEGDVIHVTRPNDEKENRSLLVMNLGFSHQVTMEEIEGISIEVPSANKIVISGVDKQKVGQFAAEVREKRPPEPYKGKGIKYTDEVIRRKEGKTGVKKK